MLKATKFWRLCVDCFSTRSILFLLSYLLILATTATNIASAAVLEGRVTDVKDKPVGGAIVTVAVAGLNSTTITTYTAGDGQFSFPNIGRTQLPASALSIQKVGYVQSGKLTLKSQGERQVALIRVKRIDNVADQVPPSAWLAGFPDTPEAHLVLLNCSQCHQLPHGQSKDYIQKFSMLSTDQREQVWHDVLKYMRAKGGTIAPAGIRPDVSKIPLEIYSQDGRFSYSHADEAKMAPVLAKYMPLKFDSYPLSDYEKLLAPIGGAGTVIREYQIPPPAVAMFHDSVVARKADGTLYVYAIDWANPRMARLNPITGEIKMYPLPMGGTGGHTLVPDHEGNLWAIFQLSSQLARFDVESETWQTWAVGKAGWRVSDGKGETAKVSMAHSIAFKAGFEVGFDVNGYVWTTLFGTNQLLRINPKTGDKSVVDAPGTGEPPNVGDRSVVSGLYGGVMTADGKKVWFTQLSGALFSVNTETMKVDDIVPIARGSGPRRLTIDKDDVVYVPLNGAGALLAYDTRAKKEIGRYPLPDRAAAPYSANWDSTRNAVWISGGSAAKIYKFDIASKSYTEYPLPRKDGVIVRALPIDQRTGEIYFTYAPVAILKGPNMFVWLHPEDSASASK